MVEELKFRSDLYYRLNVFPIKVPALRERKEDIPLLVRHFVKEFSCRNNRVIDTIPSDTMQALIRYHWPGNIRELQKVIERAVLISKPPSSMYSWRAATGAQSVPSPSPVSFRSTRRKTFKTWWSGRSEIKSCVLWKRRMVWFQDQTERLLASESSVQRSNTNAQAGNSPLPCCTKGRRATLTIASSLRGPSEPPRTHNSHAESSDSPEMERPLWVYCRYSVAPEKNHKSWRE